MPPPKRLPPELDLNRLDPTLAQALRSRARPMQPVKQALIAATQQREITGLLVKAMLSLTGRVRGALEVVLGALPASEQDAELLDLATGGEARTALLANPSLRPDLAAKIVDEALDVLQQPGLDQTQETAYRLLSTWAQRPGSRATKRLTERLLDDIAAQHADASDGQSPIIGHRVIRARTVAMHLDTLTPDDLVRLYEVDGHTGIGHTARQYWSHPAADMGFRRYLLVSAREEGFRLSFLADPESLALAWVRETLLDHASPELLQGLLTQCSLTRPEFHAGVRAAADYTRRHPREAEPLLDLLLSRPEAELAGLNPKDMAPLLEHSEPRIREKALTNLLPLLRTG